jgi:hypothetical protein
MRYKTVGAWFAGGESKVGIKNMDSLPYHCVAKLVARSKDLHFGVLYVTDRAANIFVSAIA